MARVVIYKKRRKDFGRNNLVGGGSVLGTEAVTWDWLFGKLVIPVNEFLEQTAGVTPPISSTEPLLAVEAASVAGLSSGPLHLLFHPPGCSSPSSQRVASFENVGLCLKVTSLTILVFSLFPMPSLSSPLPYFIFLIFFSTR